jgi:hypothetical protein
MRGASATTAAAIAGCVAAVATATASCTGSHAISHRTVAPSESGRSTNLSLPSDGWKPGDAGLQAETGGAFHAARVGSGACAWVGDARRAFDWPANWTVIFDPSPRLLDSSGVEVAREGQRIRLVGGGSTAAQAGPCWSTGDWVFSVNQ